MVDASDRDSKLNLDEAEEWISILYAAADGYIHICSTLNWSGQTFRPDDISAMRAYIAHLDAQGAKGIYARVTTLKAPQIKGRGSDGDSHTFTGLWADIDIAGPGHKTTKPLPPTALEAMKIVDEAGLPEPTYWIHSGGGLYPWWLLDNPFEVTDPEALTRTQDISARWQVVLRDAAERLGYSYGPVGDLSRVMRIPGTVNRKVEDAPLPCMLLDSLSSRQLYSTAQLKAALEAAEEYARSLTPPPTPPRQPATPVRGEQSGERPGDALAAHLSWAEILEPHGYQLDRRQGVEDYWVRPGKHRRDGHSCTTNYGGSGLLYVFSTEMAGFEANESYSKFAAWSILNGFGRDFARASKALRSQGYGSQREASPPPQPFQPGQVADGGSPPPEAPQVVSHDESYPLSDVGNSRRLAAMVGDRFRYVKTLGQWMYWNGTVWEVDNTSAVHRAAVAVTDKILSEAAAYQAASDKHDPDAKVCHCFGCKLAKHGTSSQANTKIKGTVELFGTVEGIASRYEDFDQNKEWITLANGPLSLRTGELGEFDSRMMLTKKINASYDPQASCPQFEAFLEQVLPSAAVRDYVQRALGYTLTGENDQRALFLVHGPSGTGKSQFLSIFENLFGDFGGTAESNTFRVRRSESTHELHSLRGCRFVTTSETSESAKLDEELVKRITGGDNVSTRALYQELVTWRPEFTIWMATNFPPKMNSDDGAVWARYKPIEFNQVFSRTDGDVPNIGKRIFEEEASGILNWLLAGLRAYRQRGLGEPQELVDQVAEHRLESDTVAQFIGDALSEGVLVEDVTARELKSSTLHGMYQSWCTQEHHMALGPKRFTQRMISLGFERIRSNGTVWGGLRVSPRAGLLGTMG